VVTPADAAAVIRPLCRREQESFVVICLDVRNGMVSASVVAIGTVHGVEIHPRDVFREAIRRNASAIVVGHNHPTGDPTPSTDDLMLTRRLRAVGELLGIPLIDHVVVGEGSTYRSIAEYAPHVMA
jgi:DNA repair protein RadC